MRVHLPCPLGWEWHVGAEVTLDERDMWIIAFDESGDMVLSDIQPAWFSRREDRDSVAEHGRFRCDLAAIIGAVW